MRLRQYISEELDCSKMTGDSKTSCAINKLKRKISDLKKKSAETDDPEKREDIEYQIDALIDMIDMEQEKRDAQQDMDRATEN